MASSRRSVPSIATLRTHSSILAMSVSSSHGLTSRRMEDLATSAGFLDFLAAYSDRRCSRIRAASELSSSSSEPKRSMSSSLLLFGEAGGMTGSGGYYSNHPPFSTHIHKRGMLP
uniref:Uncharacterized protein n=1 Tax=Poecilia mexicana TaxID=48701 RepID=A0A3B3YV13_9TELE